MNSEETIVSALFFLEKKLHCQLKALDTCVLHPQLFLTHPDYIDKVTGISAVKPLPCPFECFYRAGIFPHLKLSLPKKQMIGKVFLLKRRVQPNQLNPQFFTFLLISFTRAAVECTS